MISGVRDETVIFGSNRHAIFEVATCKDNVLPRDGATSELRLSTGTRKNQFQNRFSIQDGLDFVLSNTGPGRVEVNGINSHHVAEFAAEEGEQDRLFRRLS
jgi:hypothetical protein